MRKKEWIIYKPIKGYKNWAIIKKYVPNFPIVFLTKSWYVLTPAFSPVLIRINIE